VQPVAVKPDLGLLRVENFEDLCFIGLGVLLDLFTRERRTGGVASRRIADHAGEVTDQENDLMAHILKVLHFAQQHGVAQVQVGCGRVETGLHAQRLAGLLRLLELVSEFSDRDDFGGTLQDVIELLLYVGKVHGQKTL
jgi:hypothetical protein